MCGIFAYLLDDSHPATTAPQLVIEGLKTLEYRGYDSWGVAVRHPADGLHRLEVTRAVGKISAVGDGAALGAARAALGHSRWATHGGVTEANAHPHRGCDDRMALVHNGIVENYQPLKQELIAGGHRFVSQTDTEVIAHLIEHEMQASASDSVEEWVAAVGRAFRQLDGRNAIAVLLRDHPAVIAVRSGSPLVVGRDADTGAWMLSSDTVGLLHYTAEVFPLEDNDMVVLTHVGTATATTTRQHDGQVWLRALAQPSGQEVWRRAIRAEGGEQRAQKGDYAHFMLKEIMEQREALERALNQPPATLERVRALLTNARDILFAGCGTAGRVAQIGTYLFSEVAGRTTSALLGSEFANYAHSLDEHTVLVAISQSGETADLMEAVEVARAHGSRIVAVVNVPGSTLARLADEVLLVNAGPEKAVASTKATVGQIAILGLLAYACLGQIEQGRAIFSAAASQVPTLLSAERRAALRDLAARLRWVPHLYIIGRNMNYPVALEAAIKIQEVSYIHAEGIAGGELKHYAIALIEQGTPCIVLVSNDDARAEILGNASEVRARGGYIIGIAPTPNEVFDLHIPVPDTGVASSITSLIPVQVLAYELALARGYDPDMPRNLAKSVTVK